MNRKLRFVLAIGGILALLLIATGSVTAQTKGTSTLTGVVVGPDDKPVPRAAVSYQSSGGEMPHAVHTDSHGRFTITKLRADNYDIRASGKGVFSEWQKNVTLHKGQTREITLRMIYAKSVPKAYVGKKSQSSSNATGASTKPQN